MLFGDLPRLNAARYPNKLAVVDGQTRLTWAQLDGQANRFANALLSLGVGRGDRMATLTSIRHEWLIAVYSAAKVGVTIVPIGTHCTTDEVRFFVKEANTRIVIVDEANLARADEAFGGEPCINHCVAFGEAPCGPSWLKYKDLLARQDDDLPATNVEGDDELIVLFSSGTTGQPKGVVLTHRQAMSLAMTNVVALGTRYDDVGMAFLPVNHKGAFNQFKLHAAVGASIVILNGFEVREFLSAIERERVTDTVCFPSMFQDMFALPGFDSYNLSSLRRVMITGTVMTRASFEEAIARLPHVEFQHAYGLTDAGGLVTVLAGKDHGSKLGSVGKAVPFTEVQIHDERGHPAPAGEVGEIVCRSDSIMKGYLNQPELTHRALQHGWLHTGDLGKFDDDGYLWVVGRLKDLIKTGGENVSPMEVEEVLSLHSAVQEAAVFGVPDERWGEAVIAAVVLRPGRLATERELIEFCSGRLSHFKKPKRVHFIDSLPKNPLGAKVLKNELKERFSVNIPG